MPQGAAGQWDPRSVPCHGLYQLQMEWVGDGAQAATAGTASLSTMPAGSWLRCSSTALPARLCVPLCSPLRRVPLRPCPIQPSARAVSPAAPPVPPPQPGMCWMLGTADGGGGGGSSRLISSRCGCWEPSSAPPPCRGPRVGRWLLERLEQTKQPPARLLHCSWAVYGIPRLCGSAAALFPSVSAPACTDPGAATQPQLLAAMGQVVLHSPPAPALLGALGTLGRVLRVLHFLCSDAFGNSVRPPASPGCAFPLCPSIPAPPSCQPMCPSPGPSCPRAPLGKPPWCRGCVGWARCGSQAVTWTRTNDGTKGTVFKTEPRAWFTVRELQQRLLLSYLSGPSARTRVLPGTRSVLLGSSLPLPGDAGLRLGSWEARG